MKKLGLGKKKGELDDDSSRLALFGSRSKSKSPAPPSSNPYAAVPPDPYTQAKMRAGIVPPQPGTSQDRLPYQGGSQQNGGYGGMPPPSQAPPSGYGRDMGRGGPQDKYGAPQGGFGPGGYGADRYGNQSGYGAEKSGGNPYAAVPQTSGASRFNDVRPGGYGGLGRTNSSETATTDMNRDALFGGAAERVQKQQEQGPPGYQYGAEDDTKSYGAYGDRQLTAEEEEEEDINATKQQIKFMKQQDVSSTRNALRMADQAEETGRNTLARLGAQGERIHNTERNLDIAANQNAMAEDKARELKTINRSMFAVHVNNPFTGKERREKREQQIMDRHRMEREQREETREKAFQSSQRMKSNFQGLDSQPTPKTGASLAERAKYQFEADSEDDQLEDEIEDNLDQLSGAAKRLNVLARATGSEVEAQNEHLLRIAGKVCFHTSILISVYLYADKIVQSDRIDDQLNLNTERLKRIH
jgi:protein transport protein SEC9